MALVGFPGAPAGAAGVDVAKWQRRLNALHCDAGPADGKSGTWTRSAILRFQSRYGCRRTGRSAQRRATALFAATAQRCDVRPLPARSGSGRRIVISQKQNWVWVVAAGNRVVAQGGIVDNPGGCTGAASAPGRTAAGRRG